MKKTIRNLNIAWLLAILFSTVSVQGMELEHGDQLRDIQPKLQGKISVEPTEMQLWGLASLSGITLLTTESIVAPMSVFLLGAYGLSRMLLAKEIELIKAHKQYDEVTVKSYYRLINQYNDDNSDESQDTPNLIDFYHRQYKYYNPMFIAIKEFLININMPDNHSCVCCCRVEEIFSMNCLRCCVSESESDNSESDNNVCDIIKVARNSVIPMDRLRVLYQREIHRTFSKPGSASDIEPDSDSESGIMYPHHPEHSNLVSDFFISESDVSCDDPSISYSEWEGSDEGPTLNEAAIKLVIRGEKNSASAIKITPKDDKTDTFVLLFLFGCTAFMATIEHSLL